MRQRIWQIMTSLLLIMTLTMANFLAICVNVVSYANEIINLEQATNHKNVDFMAYFKDEEGNESNSLDVFTNAKDLKIYFKISVKQEGYFNGNILLNNANFKFKSDVISADVNKIEDNALYLNQIKAGESKEFEIEIELLNDDKFDLDFIDLENVILIQGVYRDKTQKDISIKSERNVELNLVSPYQKAEESIILSQNVITNKILNYNGEAKRIIQVEVESGLKDNLYPIKQSVINITVPKILDIYPENVLVNSNYDLGTNGNKFVEDNWNYDRETGTINITIENQVDDNNKVSWLKDAHDSFVITYVFDKDVDISDIKSVIDSKINLYDKNNTSFEAMNEISVDNTEKDTIIKTEIYQNEIDIYKGKIYSGISKEISYSTILNVNLVGVATEVNVVENGQMLNGKNIDSTYSQTILNKNNIKDVLGEDGILTILNAKTNTEIVKISSETETDENGNVVISYPEDVTEIMIKTTAPKNVGIIEIKSTKLIGKISKNDAKTVTSIDFKLTGNYVVNDNITNLNETDSCIELKETQTSAYLEINKTELSTMSVNNVEMRVVLKSRDENNELYKNPVIRIQLPSKIEKIDINSVNLVYDDELKIVDTKLVDGNIIEIHLKGEQTKYKEEAIDGSIIIINANLTTSKKLPSSTEKIVVTYTNDNGINYENGAEIGKIEKQIDLVSYAGVVTINKVAEYGEEIINNEIDNKVISIDMNSSKNKEVKIENEIINNNENKITNVKILGILPTEGANQNINNMKTLINGEISVSGIDLERVKIYYSENANATADLDNAENAWSDNITNSEGVKKYLVIIDELDVTEGLNISYIVKLPNELDYNLNAQESFDVYYTSMAAEEKLEVNSIRLSTPVGAILETELKVTVAGKEADFVRKNSVLRYVINISNTGSEEVSNVKVLANVPEGTVYVNSDQLNNEIMLDDLIFEDLNKKDVEFNIDKLAPGETVTKYYEVKVNDDIESNEISNFVTTQYGDVTKKSNEVKTEVQDGNIELKFISVDATDEILYSGYRYRYILQIKNTSDSKIKDVKATINIPEIMEVSRIYYMGDEKSTSVTETNVMTIDSINAGETLELIINVTVKTTKQVGEIPTSISATVEHKKNEYYSNEINNKVFSRFSLDMNVSSVNSGSYVKAGDIITYNVNIKNTGTETAYIVKLNNWIPNDVTLTKITRNGIELTENDYDFYVDSDKHQKIIVIDEYTISAGESISYKIEVIANLIPGNTDAIELISEYELKSDGFEIASDKIQHILEPETDISGDGDNDDGNNDNNPGTDVDGNKIISGVAWVDENENGQRESNEQVIEGIVVKLLDVTTNEFVKDSNGNVLTAKTTSTGFYSFNELEKGQYLVIFEYDNTKYGLTEFEKEGVSNEVNSNVITKTIKVDGVDLKVAATEVIIIEKDNISNINIGLVVSKKYDLQLDKYISKVTVQNNKTVTKEYDNQTLVKHEIDAKQVNSTVVVVEYTIKVTNNGDVTGYVKKIADYLSVDYKFSSELNKDWYQSGNDLYCTSLANEKLEPGQSKEVKLTVIKEMNENNIGLVNNMAEIVDSYNELGLTDINSTEGNKVKGENDMGSADLIISIRTGQVVMTFSLIILTIAMAGFAVYIVKRINDDKKIM